MIAASLFQFLYVWLAMATMLERLAAHPMAEPTSVCAEAVS